MPKERNKFTEWKKSLTRLRQEPYEKPWHPTESGPKRDTVCQGWKVNRSFLHSSICRRPLSPPILSQRRPVGATDAGWREASRQWAHEDFLPEQQPGSPSVPSSKEKSFPPSTWNLSQTQHEKYDNVLAPPTVLFWRLCRIDPKIGWTSNSP